jgi:hypothetical protein
LTYKDLSHVPRHLVTLDGKIAAALIRLCHGDLGRKVALWNQKSIDEEDQPLASTQILRLIYESLKTTQSIRTFTTVMDLSHLKWLGDDRMPAFMNNWREVVDPLTDISEGTKCDLLLAHMDQSGKLRSEADHFRRMDLDDPNRTLFWLENSIEKRITLDSERENIRVKHKALEGKYGPSNISSQPLLHQSNQDQGSGASGAGKVKGKAKASAKSAPSASPAVASSTACFYCGQEGHRQADCPKKAASGKGGKGKGKGKGAKGKSKEGGKGKGGKATSDGDKAERAVLDKRGSNGMGPCLWQFEPGGCRAEANGSCRFAHDVVLTEAEKQILAKIAKRRARSRSQSRGATAPHSIDKPCRNHAAGKCQYGDNCFYKH